MLADKLIPHIDTVLRTLFAPAATSRTEPSGSVILNICDMVAPMAGRAKRGKLLRRPSRIVFGLSSA